jgi:hypothetical protein
MEENGKPELTIELWYRGWCSCGNSGKTVSSYQRVRDEFL